MTDPEEVGGFHLWRGALDHAEQVALVEELRAIVSLAPFYVPVTPGGSKMSVRMTNAGRLGWITDRQGYRYQDHHPSGQEWPAIPNRIIRLWRDITREARDPDCCLINYYADGARMGLHQDRDEGDFNFPVLSISLGDDALFRVGGVEKPAPTQSFWLRSGDVLMFGGAARLAWHGVDRIRFGSSSLLSHGGRLNLTLRVVGPVPAHS